MSRENLTTESSQLEASRFWESIVRNTAEGICVFIQTEDFPYVRFLVWNDRMVELTGYEMDEINRLGWYQTVYTTPQMQEKSRQCMAQIREGKTLENQEWEITHKNGQHRDLKISTRFVDRHDGTQAVVALMEDVTGEREYRLALEESERRLTLAMRAANLGLWDWNIETDVAYLSPEWKAQIGFAENELSNHFSSWEQRLHPDDRPIVLRMLDDYLRGKEPNYATEFRIRHKEGKYRWIQTRGVAERGEDGKAYRMLGCHIDVTKRKSAEDTLRYILHSVVSMTGQEFFAKLADYLCDACGVDIAYVAEIPVTGGTFARSIAAAGPEGELDNFEYDILDTPCATVWDRADICYYEDVQTSFPADELLVEIGAQSYMGIPLLDSRGKSIGIITLLHSEPFEDEALAASILRVLGARCSAELERVRAEEAVRRSEYRLQSIASTTPLALFVFNLNENRIEYVNRFGVEELGYTEEEIQAMGDGFPMALIHPGDAAVVQESIANARESEEGEVQEAQFRLQHKTKGWRNYHFRSTVYERDASGCVVSAIGSAVDITPKIQAEVQRKKLEAQMQRAQKLESLGVLAGGIAHDFNNLLTSIMGFADLALLSVAQDSKPYAALLEIINGVKSASELTQQMLAYSGKARFEERPVDLSQVIRETSRLLQVSVSKNCELRLRLAECLPHCLGDVGQLRQVIMNLIINASEAIGDQAGVILVSTQEKELGEEGDPTENTQDLKPGKYICLTVADDGCGMDDQVSQRIYDPFFSTKFSGRGLGMSAVLGIIRGHKGAIYCTSEPEVGTTFEVWLPAYEQGIESEVEEVALKAAPRTGKQRILIADDEQVVRRSTKILLTDLGFEVISVENGAEAVRSFREDPSFDLILLDLTMPVMDGLQACEQIREVCPGARIVLMSGYNEEWTRDAELKPSHIRFLKKPFRLHDLQQIVQQALGDSSR